MQDLLDNSRFVSILDIAEMCLDKMDESQIAEMYEEEKWECNYCDNFSGLWGEYDEHMGQCPGTAPVPSLPTPSYRMSHAGQIAGGDIAEMNQSLIRCIRGTIEWLEQDQYHQSDPMYRKGMRFGRRRLAYVLSGSANSTAMNLRFYDCPYWGCLAFLSVRRITKILDFLVYYDVLVEKESPRWRAIVLANSEDYDDNIFGDTDFTPDIASRYADIRRLRLDLVDQDLLKILKEKRWTYAKNALGKYGRPFHVCSDRVLIQLCLHRPKNLDEFDQYIVATKAFRNQYATQFIKIIKKQSE